MNVKDEEIKDLLNKYTKIAVYGLSSDSSKASYRIPMFMRSKGYDIVGIYPKYEVINEVKIYKSLKDVPAEHRKFLNVFRRSEKIPELVDEVLEVGGVEFLWLQLGITHPAAEKKAEAAGIKVVSDRCLMVEYRNHLGLL
jgi:hypothetical protein